MTLKEIINEMDLDYMQIIRNGESPIEVVREAGYVQCEQCNGWVGCEDCPITDGIGAGITICENCHEYKPNAKWVKIAIEAARKDGYDV